MRVCLLVECLDAGIANLFEMKAGPIIDVGPPPVDMPDDDPEWTSWRQAMRQKDALRRPRYVPMSEQSLRRLLRRVTSRKGA
jgi:hypothetical protein